MFYWAGWLTTCQTVGAIFQAKGVRNAPPADVLDRWRSVTGSLSSFNGVVPILVEAIRAIQERSASLRPPAVAKEPDPFRPCNARRFFGRTISQFLKLT